MDFQSIALPSELQHHRFGNANIGTNFGFRKYFFQYRTQIALWFAEKVHPSGKEGLEFRPVVERPDGRFEAAEPSLLPVQDNLYEDIGQACCGGGFLLPVENELKFSAHRGTEILEGEGDILGA